MKTTDSVVHGQQTKHGISSLAGLFLTLMFSGFANAGTIVGTVHDFTTKAWSGGQICVACHTPHGANTTVATAPLWNHAITTATYTVYSNASTLNATIGQPDGTSKLCLSCHDGTVALDSFGGTTGTTFLTGTKAVGGDAASLSNDHPISFTFDDALATTDGALYPPSSTSVTIGAVGRQKTGSITNTMLFSGKVQCASCHDVHNTFADGAKLLRVSLTGSKLCLTCHNK